MAWHQLNDPMLQAMIALNSQQVEQIIKRIAQQYDFDIAIAVMMAGVGDALGALQAEHQRHAENCDTCSKKDLDYHKLALMNFEAAFKHAKEDIENEAAEGRKAADNFLDGILKGHGK